MPDVGSASSINDTGSASVPHAGMSEAVAAPPRRRVFRPAVAAGDLCDGPARDGAEAPDRIADRDHDVGFHVLRQAEDLARGVAVTEAEAGDRSGEKNAGH